MKQLKDVLAKKTPNSNNNRTLDNSKNLSVTLGMKSQDTATVDGPDEPQVWKFSISYIVYNTTWRPMYDIRVSTIGEEDSIGLSYFGEVTQKSGEDWYDCELVLSTSNPAINSEPPPLQIKTVDFYQSYSRRNAGRRQVNEYEDRGSFQLMQNGFPGQQAYFDQYAMMSNNQTEDFKKAHVEGTGDAGSTVFTITRKVSIASDNKPHKVMITSKRFKPQMVHYTVPSESAYVYIQMKARNTSGFPLLQSDKVNIYLDGNFVSKTTMKQANSGETFQLFLGVDPAVKVEYLPTKYEEYKRGWISGVEIKKVYHKILIHNTKSTACRIIIADCLPSTTNEKITVDLIEPAASAILADSSKAAFSSATEAITNLTELNQETPPVDGNTPAERIWPADFITKNKATNNIIWFKTVNAGAKAEIPFSYRLSWPQGNQVFINDA